MVANRSPRPRPFTSGIPLPRSLSVVPVCVPVRHFDRLGSVECPHLDLAAEGDGREVHRDLAEQVVPVAAEELVLLDVDDDKQVARRAAGRARFAFVLQPKLLPGRDAGWNLDRDLALANDRARCRGTLRTAWR